MEYAAILAQSRRCSMTNTVPPGFSTRASSRKNATRSSSSRTSCADNISTTVSKLVSPSGTDVERIDID